MRRHGAVNQKAITKAELKLYRQLVQARLQKNKDGPLWAKLEARWKAVVSLAEEIVAECRTGKPMNRDKRRAAREIVKLAGAVQPREIIETVLALYLLQDQEPRKIKGDTAFRTQMVRRVRGLTVLNAEAWPCPKTGKPKRAYEELSPKAVTVMSGWLAQALGEAGLLMAKLERRDHEDRQKELRNYHEALKDMQ